VDPWKLCQPLDPPRPLTCFKAPPSSRWIVIIFKARRLCSLMRSPAKVPSCGGVAVRGFVGNTFRVVTAGIQHCARFYDFIGHTVINRHLELGRLQLYVSCSCAGSLYLRVSMCVRNRLWRRHHISLRYPPAASLAAPPVIASSGGWHTDPVALMTDDLKRQGVPSRFWRLSTVNRDYRLCDTYPPVIAVPHGVTDGDITAAAPFRSKSVMMLCFVVCEAAVLTLSSCHPRADRLPVLTWLHPLNHASITRCSQPMVGLIGHRNSHDELLLEAIRWVHCLLPVECVLTVVRGLRV
jgi:hypothetical protein